MMLCVEMHRTKSSSADTERMEKKKKKIIRRINNEIPRHTNRSLSNEEKTLRSDEDASFQSEHIGQIEYLPVELNTNL